MKLTFSVYVYVLYICINFDVFMYLFYLYLYFDLFIFFCLFFILFSLDTVIRCCWCGLGRGMEEWKKGRGGLYNEYVYVHFFRNTLIKKTLFEKKNATWGPASYFLFKLPLY